MCAVMVGAILIIAACIVVLSCPVPADDDDAPPFMQRGKDNW